MKKISLVLAIVFYFLTGMAQTKITPAQARLICAQEMAAFTKAVSASYQKGGTYDQFQFALCGKLQPTTEGANQLKVAYNYLVQGASNEFIIKSYGGKEIAASMSVLSNLHKKGLESDGSELFGGKTAVTNDSFAKNSEGGCRWFQVWCLMQGFANWVVANWDTIAQIIATIVALFP